MRLASPYPLLPGRGRCEADDNADTNCDNLLDFPLLFWTPWLHGLARLGRDEQVLQKHTNWASSEWITACVLLGGVCPPRPSSDMVISLPPRRRKK